jgi:hypothetical protein
VALAGGQTTRAELPLEPVVARVAAPDTLPTVTAIGDPVSLSAAALLATGDTIPDVELSWSSLDAAVVEIAEGGPVARAEGSARLVASYGELADTTEVAVRAVIAAVEVTPSPVSVQQNFEQRLTATLRDRNHNTLAGRTVAWRSAAEGVATVDADGVVRGVSAGHATIVASSGGVEGTAEVTVTLPAPTAPTLTAAATGVDVDLSWTSGGTSAASYRVSRRQLDPEGAPLAAWTAIATVATTSHRDATDREDARFEYRVEACAADGRCSEPSSVATATTRPAAPAGLTLEVTHAATANEPTYDLLLSWEDRSSFEEIFRVEHAAGLTPGAYSVLADVPTADAPSYDDTQHPNSTHHYRVRACNAAGCSAPSAVASMTLDSIAPSAETRPAGEVTHDSAVLHGYVDPNESGEYQQWFELGSDPSPGNYRQVGEKNSGSTAREWSLPLVDLGIGQTYYYRIVVANAKGTTYGGVQSFTTLGETSEARVPRTPLDRRSVRVNDTGRPSAPPAHPSRGQ